MPKLISAKTGWYCVILLIGFISCNTRQKQPNDQKVAIIVSTLNNPWFVFLAEQAAAKTRELGHTPRIFDSQNNTALERDHFENAIASGFNAILFNPTDADGSVINVKAAADAGVPVFCMDREINADGLATAQILSDSYSGCVSIGRAFVETVGKEGKYAEILGLVGDNNTWNRSKGFHSVVDRYPGLQMVAQQSADFDRSKSMEVVESILQAHPDIKGIFCGNDAMAMGAYQALAASGKAGRIRVFGFDGAADVVDAIADGKINATGMQFPQTIAFSAARFADDYLRGKRDFPQKVFVSVELVQKKNVQNYLAYGAAE